MLKTDTVVTRIDDIDGTTGDGVKTRRLTLDIEIELTDANYAKVKAEIADLVRRGRRPDGKRGPDNADRRYWRKVRRWARENQQAVPASGPPPAELIAAYVAATGDSR